MPCDLSTQEEMTAAGMLDEEIKLLEKEIKAARLTAERTGITEKKPMIQIIADMEKAELNAREIAHDRFHNRMANEAKTFFDQLKLSLHMQKAKVKSEVGSD